MEKLDHKNTYFTGALDLKNRSLLEKFPEYGGYVLGKMFKLAELMDVQTELAMFRAMHPIRVLSLLQKRRTGC